jgi:hypothetical protein
MRLEGLGFSTGGKLKLLTSQLCYQYYLSVFFIRGSFLGGCRSQNPLFVRGDSKASMAKATRNMSKGQKMLIPFIY